MLRRLLLALLVIGLAFPAMQASACTEPAAVAQKHGTAHNMTMHHVPDQQPAENHHDCIGCIAPLDISLYRPVSAPGFSSGLKARIGRADQHLLDPSAPEPPPPRRTV